jgi:hypothetical protein
MPGAVAVAKYPLKSRQEKETFMFTRPLTFGKRSIGLLVPAFVLALAPAASALITHPDASVTSGDKPADAVVGRWGGNASAVAVAANYAITTRHQGGGVNTTVNFGGTNYQVAEQHVAPDVNDDGNAPDLRVVRLEKDGSDANLSDWVDIYENTDEPARTDPITMAGFGEGRGSALSPPQQGYIWNGLQGTLRFGMNNVDTATTGTQSFGGGTLGSDLLTADFDGPGDATSEGDEEATVATGDSGGPWLFKDSITGAWSVAGLTRGVQNPDEAVYGPFPEVMTAVRVSSYANFINDTVPEPASLTLLGLGGVLLMPRRGRQAAIANRG